ncbi:MAG: KUP/HAK/KT family potassium transporter [Leptospiraceae bacterium]|nr:KUP/HAK/KT family potassium transporter [Leptospiraceae bacterium]MDW8307654.1 KUP/HAK/KT family potassium transporter [Leptospiraceae bacterium]
MKADSHKTNLAGLLVALGIIYGDIGTSPLYVLQAVVGEKIITRELILGALSCIFWTLTIQTTLKYVIVTLNADNHGEGGIFALYALVRRRHKLLIYPAIVGGASLLSEAIITPPISVSSAIEGLQILNPEIPTVPIVIAIIAGIFLFQQFGTNVVGRSFGPIMFLWFTMLAILGLEHIADDWHVLLAINPYYAIKLLTEYPEGFWILGAVFLCTTGAEALYSDLGHCGRRNIRLTWIFVKSALLLNYFGQGAYLLSREGQLLSGKNPFYLIMPNWFLPAGIAIATVAAIIASQAVISGTFTLISEAIRLNVWPRVRIMYPTLLKGQIYVPSANRLLFVGCVLIVLFFERSQNMEAAYGLTINIAMMMTSILLIFYLRDIRISRFAVTLGFLFTFTVESSFLVANLAKFFHGGYATIIMSSFLFLIMWSWYSARKIRNRYLEFVNLETYYEMLRELSRDFSVPKYATHLVYLTSADNPEQIESKIIYSILQKQPKRADMYWFVHVDVTDEPYTLQYKVTPLVPGEIIRIDFRLGFRVEPRINLFFRKVVTQLMRSKEVDLSSRYHSLHKFNILGDFRFVVLERVLSYGSELSLKDRIIMGIYWILKHISLSDAKAFGLDTSLVTVETVPLVVAPIKEVQLERIYDQVT